MFENLFQFVLNGNVSQITATQKILLDNRNGRNNWQKEVKITL